MKDMTSLLTQLGILAMIVTAVIVGMQRFTRFSTRMTAALAIVLGPSIGVLMHHSAYLDFAAAPEPKGTLLAAAWGLVASMAGAGITNVNLAHAVKPPPNGAMVLLCALLIGGPAMAAPGFVDNLFLAPSLSYNGHSGGALGLAYQHPATRVVFSLQAAYTYDRDAGGTVPFRVGCNTYAVPWTHAGGGQLGAVVGVLIPFGKRTP